MGDGNNPGWRRIATLVMPLLYRKKLVRPFGGRRPVEPVRRVAALFFDGHDDRVAHALVRLPAEALKLFFGALLLVFGQFLPEHEFEPRDLAIQNLRHTSVLPKRVPAPCALSTTRPMAGPFVHDVDANDQTERCYSFCKRGKVKINILFNLVNSM